MVPKGQNVNEQYYCANMLENDRAPQMIELAHTRPCSAEAGKTHFYFQEDGASSHTAKGTCAFLKKLGVKRLGGDRDGKLLWPASSPDFKPASCFLLARSEGRSPGNGAAAGRPYGAADCASEGDRQRAAREYPGSLRIYPRSASGMRRC